MCWGQRPGINGAVPLPVVADEERMRPGHWFGGQYFDTVGSVTGGTSGPQENLCHIPKVLFHNKWRKKTKVEPANPGSPGKRSFKWK